MRSPLQSRRQSLLPVLALLGVAGTALTLALPPRAAAIAGGLGGSSSSPTTPRESGGAAPSVSLFQTSASSYSGGGGGGGSSASSSSEVTSSGNASGGGGGGGEERRASRRSRATASEEGGESAGRKRTARRREREEGGTTAQSGRRREQVTAGGGKSVVDDSKDGKKAVVARLPAPGPIFTISSGFETRYIYHGLDIISFNSRYRNDGLFKSNGFPLNGSRSESSGIVFADATVEFRGLRLGLNYVQAVSPTVSRFGGSPITASADRTSLGGGDIFARPGDSVSIYRELDVHFDYTFSIVSGWLDATVGYNSFFFLDRDFKGSNYQGEVPIRLTFTRIPYVRPSFNYFRYVSDYKGVFGNLNGNYVEFRLDSTIPIIDRPNFGLSVAPYAVVSYNINYLKFAGDYDVGGWHTFETGLKVPVRFGKHFTITPFGNYGRSLADLNNPGFTSITANNFERSSADGNSGERSFGERTTFWGGVNVAYSF